MPEMPDGVEWCYEATADDVFPVTDEQFERMQAVTGGVITHDPDTRELRFVFRVTLRRDSQRDPVLMGRRLVYEALDLLPGTQPVTGAINDFRVRRGDAT